MVMLLSFAEMRHVRWRGVWGGIHYSPIYSPNVINMGRGVWGWAIDEMKGRMGDI